MACPHSLIGDPAWCSQCRGAKPVIVTRDETTGQLLKDGKPATMVVNGQEVPRPFVIGPTEHEAAHYKRGAAASARAKRKRPGV